MSILNAKISFFHIAVFLASIACLFFLVRATEAKKKPADLIADVLQSHNTVCYQFKYEKKDYIRITFSPSQENEYHKILTLMDNEITSVKSNPDCLVNYKTLDEIRRILLSLEKLQEKKSRMKSIFS